MTAVIAEMRSVRTLISPQLFARLTERIVKDKGTDRELAERIMDQALAFLGACALNPAASLAPSPTVDIGWHVFILYTEDYAAFCQDIAGRFIHHVPHDSPDAPERSACPSDVRARTLDAIERAGYAVDRELWTLTAGNCGSCHDDGNCSASGKDGNENTDTRKT